MYDYLIVGAGYAGCVLAERLASQLGKKILLVEKRNHIGGNAFDSINEYGIRIHHYGPHLFHTNEEGIVQYLSQFSDWYPYEHRVMAFVNGKNVQMPINRNTVNQVMGLNFQTDEDVQRYYDREKEEIKNIRNSEDVVVSKVGRKLYELLYKGYTTKHWGVDPSELESSVCSRLPVRTNTDERYFDDRYQLMPLHGYSAMFNNMIKHKNISISLNTTFSEIPKGTFDQLIFTGPIDEYFGYNYGKLPYRSLRFEFETYDTEYHQPVAQINYPNDYEFTRITEFKHITAQKNDKTTIAKEYSLSQGDPYYPIPNEKNFLIHKKYANDADKISSVYFVGRLASYRYYNMDQVIAQALKLFRDIANNI
jgi:UDP-galactopyranose mutase